MTLPATPLPPLNDTNWYTHYAAIDETARAHIPLTRAAGHRYVPLGDSITIAGDDYTGGASLFDSFANLLALLSGNRVRMVRNAGHGGDKSADLLTRFDTDVTPYAPTMVSVMAGTNDYTFGVTVATFQANIKALVAKIRAIGAQPILFTSPPVNGLATLDKQKIQQSNAWMIRYGAAQGITVIDAFTTWVDPTTAGNWKTTLTADAGTHPNTAGHYALAQAMATQLTPLLPQLPAAVSPFASDPNNLLGTAGYFGSNTGGIGTGWSVNWTPAAGTYTPSIVTDAQVPGSMQRLALSGAADKYQMKSTISTGFAVGDVLALSCVATTQATVGLVGLSLGAVCNGAGKTYQVDHRAASMTRVQPYLEFTVPTGTTSIDIQIKAQNVGTTTGSADYGQVTAYNLTAIGALSLS